MFASQRMRKHRLTGMIAFGLVAVMGSVGWADMLAGLPDMVVSNGEIVSVMHNGTTYIVADGDLVLGQTTRWWVDSGGNEILWVEGDPTIPPGPPVPGTSSPKAGDVGSHADNFLVTGPDISSLDGINFQETIFDNASDTFFLFERGGNDSGFWQAILDDSGTLGSAVEFTRGDLGGPLAFYEDTEQDGAGQANYGVVFTTDQLVKGVRITASGHDTFSISTPVPEPSTLLMFALGTLGLVALWRRRRL